MDGILKKLNDINEKYSNDVSETMYREFQKELTEEEITAIKLAVKISKYTTHLESVMKKYLSFYNKPLTPPPTGDV